MKQFNPSLPYDTPVKVLKPTISTVKGVKKKEYHESSEIINVSFKTYGGTEKTVNGVYTIEDTAIIETWYRPDITSICRIKRMSDEAVFDIINEPENINQRNQFLKFKVRRVKGGA